MDKSLDFLASKYIGGSLEDVVRRAQPASPNGFDGRELEMFNPIGPKDVFEIEIPVGLDPMNVLKHLKFDSRENPDEIDPSDYECPCEWLEDIDLYPLYGEVTRLAVLKQGGVTWQIVGIPFEEDLVLVLREMIDHDWPGTRYDAKRILAEYSYHSDGPGPVSWDGSGALLDFGDWWMEAYGGDSSSMTKDKIRPKPAQFDKSFVLWLAMNGATATFVLFNAECKWEDQDLRQKLVDGITDLSEIDSSIGIGHSLTKDELDSVLILLDEPASVSGALLRILSDPTGADAAPLVSAVHGAVEAQDISFLLNADAFVATLGKL